jgi:hypothetical protein
MLSIVLAVCVKDRVNLKISHLRCPLKAKGNGVIFIEVEIISKGKDDSHRDLIGEDVIIKYFNGPVSDSIPITERAIGF